MAYASYVPPTAVSSVVTSVQNQVLSAMSTSAVSAGWTVIENGYNDGTNVRWVFRSPAADFYVVFFFSNTTYNSNAGNSYQTAAVSTSIPSGAFLGFTVCEGYNATTHNLIRPAVCTTNIVACSTTDDSVGSGEISLASTVTSYGTWFQTPYAGTAWKVGTGANWYFNILTDSLSLLFDAGVSTSPITSGSLHAGKATSIVTSASTNDAYPYYASNGSTICPTRSAMNANKTAHIWPLTTVVFGIGSGAVETAVGSDLYQGGPVFAPAIGVRNNAATDRNTYGGIRLKMPRWLHCQGGSTTGTVADTFTIGGTVYIYAGFVTGFLWIQRG